MRRIPSTKLPIIVTELAYARAKVAAEMDGQSLAEFTEAALAVRVAQAERRDRERQYGEAYRHATETGGISPQRWEPEWGLSESKSFVRRPAGVERNQAGRPSSRHHQEGRGAEARSTAAKPGPERPAATRSAASMARTREDRPIDVAEHPGIPEDRWGPTPGAVDVPVRKYSKRPQN